MTDRKFLERYMLHLKNDRYMPKDVREVHYRATKLASNIDAKIGIVRIARKFIELDIFVKEENLDELIEKLAPIAQLDNVRHIIEEEVSKEKGIEDGIFYFNNERFWESHEAFEGVWKKCSGQEKETVQGIILLAVAFGKCLQPFHGILGYLGPLKLLVVDKLIHMPYTKCSHVL